MFIIILFFYSRANYNETSHSFILLVSSEIIKANVC